jgi:hypothetical protein|uniref:Uncharacterized protein n=1 Tax=Picea glauca TaxID=3330 RepID=A0A101LVE6_PICGL|nr:hypothetical protein ABT39_MTgene1883 [Picea glauca]QHR92525.1 hypothetical protein Q903MT_gene6571 [Picea sitchensis]
MFSSGQPAQMLWVTRNRIQIGFKVKRWNWLCCDWNEPKALEFEGILTLLPHEDLVLKLAMALSTLVVGLLPSHLSQH